jgi:predicted porin
MKKSLFAIAAVTAFAGAAQAQSSVTVYGTIDQGYQTFDYTNTAGLTTTAAQRKMTGMNTGGAGNGGLTSNRIGFRGVEDLGGGTRAGFVYELGLSGFSQGNDAGAVTSSTSTAVTTTGTSNPLSTTPRTAVVTLTNNTLGGIKLGYDTTSLHSTLAGHRAIGGSNFVGDLSYYSDSTSGADYRMHTNAVRMNGATYSSPVFSGAQVLVDFGQDNNKTDDGGATTASSASNRALTLAYTFGKFQVRGTTHQYNAQTTNAASAKTGYNAVSAMYDFGIVIVDALYANNKISTITGAQTAKNDVMQAGVKGKITPVITLAAQYGTGNYQGTTSADESDRTGFQLAAIYDLSKRTNIYAIYGQQDRKYTRHATVTAGTVEKVSGYGVGLRHSF